MSDTPKTDAFFRPPFLRYPAANFCRKFERENKELLEALEQLLNQFDSEIHNEYDGTGMLNDRLSEANHARRVIAKAKGETK